MQATLPNYLKPSGPTPSFLHCLASPYSHWRTPSPSPAGSQVAPNLIPGAHNLSSSCSLVPAPHTTQLWEHSIIHRLLANWRFKCMGKHSCVWYRKGKETNYKFSCAQPHTALFVIFCLSLTEHVWYLYNVSATVTVHPPLRCTIVIAYFEKAVFTI